MIDERNILDQYGIDASNLSDEQIAQVANAVARQSDRAGISSKSYRRMLGSMQEADTAKLAQEEQKRINDFQFDPNNKDHEGVVDVRNQENDSILNKVLGSVGIDGVEMRSDTWGGRALLRGQAGVSRTVAGVLRATDALIEKIPPSMGPVKFAAGGWAPLKEYADLLSSEADAIDFFNMRDEDASGLEKFATDVIQAMPAMAVTIAGTALTGGAAGLAAAGSSNAVRLGQFSYMVTESFGNKFEESYQSAKRAGYSEEEAQGIAAKDGAVFGVTTGLLNMAMGKALGETVGRIPVIRRTAERVVGQKIIGPMLAGAADEGLEEGLQDVLFDVYTATLDVDRNMAGRIVDTSQMINLDYWKEKGYSALVGGALGAAMPSGGRTSSGRVIDAKGSLGRAQQRVAGLTGEQQTAVKSIREAGTSRKSVYEAMAANGINRETFLEATGLDIDKLSDREKIADLDEGQFARLFTEDSPMGREARRQENVDTANEIRQQQSDAATAEIADLRERARKARVQAEGAAPAIARRLNRDAVSLEQQADRLESEAPAAPAATAQPEAAPEAAAEPAAEPAAEAAPEAAAEPAPEAAPEADAATEPAAEPKKRDPLPSEGVERELAMRQMKLDVRVRRVNEDPNLTAEQKQEKVRELEAEEAKWLSERRKGEMDTERKGTEAMFKEGINSDLARTMNSEQLKKTVEDRVAEIEANKVLDDTQKRELIEQVRDADAAWRADNVSITSEIDQTARKEAREEVRQREEAEAVEASIAGTDKLIADHADKNSLAGAAARFARDVRKATGNAKVVVEPIQNMPKKMQQQLRRLGQAGIAVVMVRSPELGIPGYRDRKTNALVLNLDSIEAVAEARGESTNAVVGQAILAHEIVHTKEGTPEYDRMLEWAKKNHPQKLTEAAIEYMDAIGLKTDNLADVAKWMSTEGGKSETLAKFVENMVREDPVAAAAFFEGVMTTTKAGDNRGFIKRVVDAVLEFLREHSIIGDKYQPLRDMLNENRKQQAFLKKWKEDAPKREQERLQQIVEDNAEASKRAAREQEERRQRAMHERNIEVERLRKEADQRVGKLVTPLVEKEAIANETKQGEFWQDRQSAELEKKVEQQRKDAKFRRRSEAAKKAAETRRRRQREETEAINRSLATLFGGDAQFARVTMGEQLPTKDGDMLPPRFYHLAVNGRIQQEGLKRAAAGTGSMGRERSRVMNADGSVNMREATVNFYSAGRRAEWRVAANAKYFATINRDDFNILTKESKDFAEVLEGAKQIQEERGGSMFAAMSEYASQLGYDGYLETDQWALNEGHLALWGDVPRDLIDQVGELDRDLKKYLVERDTVKYEELADKYDFARVDVRRFQSPNFGRGDTRLVQPNKPFFSAISGHKQRTESYTLEDVITMMPPVAQDRYKGSTLMEKFDQQKEEMKKLAIEGESVKNWYDSSSLIIAELAGLDLSRPLEEQPERLRVAQEMAVVFAQMSPSTLVYQNTHQAAKILTQFISDAAIDRPTLKAHMYTSNDKKAIATLIEKRLEDAAKDSAIVDKLLGQKTGNFARNLSILWDKANSQGTTVDMWMARVMGFPQDTVTALEFVYGEKLFAAAAAELETQEYNADGSLKFDENGNPVMRKWRPDEVQAAVWVVAKARWVEARKKVLETSDADQVIITRNKQGKITKREFAFWKNAFIAKKGNRNLPEEAIDMTREELDAIAKDLEEAESKKKGKKNKDDAPTIRVPLKPEFAEGMKADDDGKVYGNLVIKPLTYEVMKRNEIFTAGMSSDLDNISPELLTRMSFNFVDGVYKSAGALSVESQPSPALNLMQRVQEQPYEKQVEYHERLINAMMDNTYGKLAPLAHAGVLEVARSTQIGAYFDDQTGKYETNPVSQIVTLTGKMSQRDVVLMIAFEEGAFGDMTLEEAFRYMDERAVFKGDEDADSDAEVDEAPVEGDENIEEKGGWDDSNTKLPNGKKLSFYSKAAGKSHRMDQASAGAARAAAHAMSLAQLQNSVGGGRPFYKDDGEVSSTASNMVELNAQRNLMPDEIAKLEQTANTFISAGKSLRKSLKVRLPKPPKKDQGGSPEIAWANYKAKCVEVIKAALKKAEQSIKDKDFPMPPELAALFPKFTDGGNPRGLKKDEIKSIALTAMLISPAEFAYVVTTAGGARVVFGTGYDGSVGYAKTQVLEIIGKTLAATLDIDPDGDYFTTFSSGATAWNMVTKNMRLGAYNGQLYDGDWTEEGGLGQQHIDAIIDEQRYDMLKVAYYSTYNTQLERRDIAKELGETGTDKVVNSVLDRLETAMDDNGVSYKPVPRFDGQFARVSIPPKAKEAIDAAGGSWKKHFFSAGNLDPAVQRAKMESNGRIMSEIEKARRLSRELTSAVKREVQRGSFPNSVVAMQRLNDYLLDDHKKGQQAPASLYALPEELRPIAIRMRSHIDGLSNEMIANGFISEEMKAVVKDNLQTYVTRSYKAFDDKHWKKKAKANTKIMADAAAFFRSVDPNLTDNQIDQMINEILDNAASGGFSGILRNEASRPVQILKQRKDIPAAIRALLGEYEGADSNYLKTVERQAMFVGRSQFLRDVKDIGLKNGWLFAKGDPNIDPKATAQFTKEKMNKKGQYNDNSAAAPLQGFYTYPEVVEALSVETKAMPMWLKTAVGFNAAVKAGKTVGSPITHVRNLVGNTYFALAAGHLTPTLGTVSSVKDAFSVTFADLRGKGKPAVEARLRELMELGVIRSDIDMGLISDLVNDTGIDWDKLNAPSTSKSPIVRAGSKVVKGTVRGAARLYQAEDDIWKAFAFDQEYKTYRKLYPNKPEAEVKRMAADNVRSLYPNYSMVPNAVKALRTVPVVGTFIAFPYEVVRTRLATMRLIQRELADPTTRTLGAKRLAGFMTAHAASVAAAGILKAIFGWDDEEEEAVRRTTAPWNQNATLAPVGVDANGNRRVLNISYTDPFSVINKPITALMRGMRGDITPEKAAMDFVLEAFGAYIQPEIAVEAVMEILYNKKASGGPVYIEGASVPAKVSAMAYHFGKASAPGIVGQSQRMKRAITGEVDQYGKSYNLLDEVAGMLTGTRPETVDMQANLGFQVTNYLKRARNAKAALNRAFRDQSSNADPEKFRRAYRIADGADSNLFEDMHKTVDLVRRSEGLTFGEMINILEGSGMSKNDAERMVYGQREPLKISDRSAKETAARIQRTRPATGSDIHTALYERLQVIREEHLSQM